MPCCLTYIHQMLVQKYTEMFADDSWREQILIIIQSTINNVAITIIIEVTSTTYVANNDLGVSANCDGGTCH